MNKPIIIFAFIIALGASVIMIGGSVRTEKAEAEYGYPSCYGGCCCCCTDECTWGSKRCRNGKVETCNNYDCDDCSEWGGATSCPVGYECSGKGQCTLICSDECASGAKRCANGKVETCGNYDGDSCAEWGGAADCNGGQVCTGNGECKCTDQAIKKCNGNDLYWYDSCDNLQGIAQDCQDGQWSDNYSCFENWTQRERINRGCSDQQCYENTEWIKEYDCSLDNKKCDGGQCVIICSDECASGAKRCANGKVETCGNYDGDSCTEWGDAQDCQAGKICSGDGICGCSSHAKKECVGNDLYWHDSCNNPQELAEDCGENQENQDKRCSGDFIQHEKISRGCFNQQCYETAEWVSEHNCVEDNKKCDGGQCVINCADQCITGIRRCANGKVETCGNYDGDSCAEWGNAQNCASGRSCVGAGECGCIDHAAKRCNGSDLYWYDSCNNRQELAEDCGEEKMYDNYRCSGNWIQQKRIKRGCSNQQCYSITDWVNQENCDNNDKRCDDGECVETCVNHCAYGTKRCFDDEVETCGNYDGDACTEWGGAVKCSADKVCVDGKCGCYNHEKKQCQDNNLYWFDSCKNMQEMAQNCGDYGCDAGMDACNTVSQKATLIVKKTMVGGTDTFVFSGMPNGRISTNNGTITATVRPGKYAVNEIAKDGWNLTNIVCSDGDSIGNINSRTATFSVSSGETVTCIFTNTIQPKVLGIIERASYVSTGAISEFFMKIKKMIF
ncbi:MAG TPA: hypothetical protein P5080_05590 [Candidatus Paceibacterota bacterium]|nr:hypothetical protein [Candidatus Pacearchaeota archaeon]HRZ51419.1 hypothetical protein [Candidatus Paceibacterota bacterium]HSA37141.1 hypothetical protein [Candidatus Paceibacterota bacterium]